MSVTHEPPAGNGAPAIVGSPYETVPAADGEPPAAVAGAYQYLLERAWPYLHTRGNDEHTVGSVLFAWQLLEAEGGDPDVVIPAVILHDVGWSRLSDDEQHRAFGPPPRDVAMNKLHEQQGAEIATEILRSVGYDPALSEEITEIVRGHDNRREALSLNDAVVKDADRLFRLTRRGYTIFLEFFTLEFRPYLEAMAAQVHTWYYTETGKRLGASMLDDLAVYIDGLEAEAAAAAGLDPGAPPPTRPYTAPSTTA